MGEISVYVSTSVPVNLYTCILIVKPHTVENAYTRLLMSMQGRAHEFSVKSSPLILGHPQQCDAQYPPPVLHVKAFST